MTRGFSWPGTGARSRSGRRGRARARRTRRGGVGDLRGGHEPGRLAGAARALEQGRHRVLVHVDADRAVVRPHAARVGGRARGGVGHRLLGVGGVGVDEAAVAEPVHLQRAGMPERPEPDQLALRRAHPVAVQEDHVACALRGGGGGCRGQQRERRDQRGPSDHAGSPPLRRVEERVPAALTITRVAGSAFGRPRQRGVADPRDVRGHRGLGGRARRRRRSPRRSRGAR